MWDRGSLHVHHWGAHMAPCLMEPQTPGLPPHSSLARAPSSPASFLLLHILDDGALGESQLVISLGLVVKEGFDCTLQGTGTLMRIQSLPATLLTWDLTYAHTCLAFQLGLRW